MPTQDFDLPPRRRSYSEAQAKFAFDLGSKTLKRLAAEGKVRAPIIAGRRLYNADDLESLISAETSPPIHNRQGLGRGIKIPDVSGMTPEQILSSPVLILNLTSRAFNFICRDQGIQTVKDLVEFSDVDILRMDKIGRKTLEEIERKLAYLNLTLKGEVATTEAA